MEIFNNPKHKTVFKSDGDWVEVKESDQKFYYLERKGKNSIAVLLYDDNERVLVRFQPLCAVEELGDAKNRLAPCPITGSVDEDDSSYLEAAIREVKEETGYDVADVIKSTGSYIVSTQCNEICYTFIANVTGKTPEDAKNDGSYFEGISENEWVFVYDVFDLKNIYGGLIILADQVIEESMK